MIAKMKQMRETVEQSKFKLIELVKQDEPDDLIRVEDSDEKDPLNVPINM